MRKECHPIVCELIDNRIVPGAAYKYVLDFGDPAETIKHGRFTILDFNRTDSEGIDMTNVRLIFIDNKAVKAFAESCTWEYVFFNIMTEDEKIEFENIFGVV
ncbi:MAG: hypothetical protein JW709_07125 [Sedimentisphaerales bacterium]|nr:hypothetical protein [Sedimentisphaerales bacterium]